MRAFPDLSSHKEFRVFKKLKSPEKIQDFLDGLRINFERRGETCRSPLMALRHGEAHCMEGAVLAAAAFWYNGAKPLLLDLTTTENDDDHVVTLFRRNNRWGAVSKTNHAVLRYRDPIYKNVRELALSYFNEYFLDNGAKTLRRYSAPFNLLDFGDEWLTATRDLYDVTDALDASTHFEIFKKGTRLRRADPLEIKAGKLLEWHS